MLLRAAHALRRAPRAPMASTLSFASEQDRETAAFHFKGGEFHARVPLPTDDGLVEYRVAVPESGTVRDLRATIEQIVGDTKDFAVRGRDGVALAQGTEMRELPFGRYTLEVNDTELALCADLRADERVDVDAALDQGAGAPALEPVLARAFDTSGALFAQEKRDAEDRLAALRADEARLQAVRSVLEARAHRSTSLKKWASLGVMATQFGVLSWLVWGELGWDQITYFISLISVVGTSWFFALRSRDPTYPHLWDQSYNKKLQKLIKSTRFDEAGLLRTREQAEAVEEEIARLQLRLGSS